MYAATSSLYLKKKRIKNIYCFKKCSNITKAKFIKQLPVDNCLIDTWRITYSTWDYTPEIHVSVFDIAHGGKLSGKI